MQHHMTCTLQLYSTYSVHCTCCTIYSILCTHISDLVWFEHVNPFVIDNWYKLNCMCPALVAETICCQLQINRRKFKYICIKIFHECIELTLSIVPVKSKFCGLSPYCVIVRIICTRNLLFTYANLPGCMFFCVCETVYTSHILSIKRHYD